MILVLDLLHNLCFVQSLRKSSLRPPTISPFCSLYTLIFALFDKTDGMISALQKMEEMKNAGVNFGLDLGTTESPIRKDCFTVPIPCELLSR